jgi:DNA-binding transcriptional MerR regulator
MYSIRRFAKMSRISLRMLRYYDKFNLLKPTHVNDKTKYRYYNDSQLKEALEISRLARFGFSLSEIKSILCGNEEYFKYYW